MTLLAVNLVFAAVVGFLAWRWWASRRAVEPMGIDLRVKAVPPDEEQVGDWVERALRRVGPAAARRSGPVVGDAWTLVELEAADADDVLAALVEVLLADGYDVTSTKGRRVQLRRDDERVVLDVAPSA